MGSDRGCARERGESEVAKVLAWRSDLLLLSLKPSDGHKVLTAPDGADAFLEFIQHR